jgi:3-oxoacyl-[acyl-carrier protein] reductase
MKVLLTGGTKGIGEGIVKTFAKKGYEIGFCYKESKQKANNLMKNTSDGQKVFGKKFDIADEGQARDFVHWGFEKLSQPDTLVLNAGFNRDGPFLEMSTDDWKNVIDVHLNSAFYIAQEFLKLLEKKEGNIITIASTTAITGRKNGANYCSAKAGLITFTKCLALEFAPRVRANCIIPGAFETEEVLDRYDLHDEDRRKELEQRIPLGRLGQPEEIADIIEFIVLRAKYMTGQSITYSGGLNMS